MTCKAEYLLSGPLPKKFANSILDENRISFINNLVVNSKYLDYANSSKVEDSARNRTISRNCAIPF